MTGPPGYPAGWATVAATAGRVSATQGHVALNRRRCFLLVPSISACQPACLPNLCFPSTAKQQAPTHLMVRPLLAAWQPRQASCCRRRRPALPTWQLVGSLHTRQVATARSIPGHSRACRCRHNRALCIAACRSNPICLCPGAGACEWPRKAAQAGPRPAGQGRACRQLMSSLRFQTQLPGQLVSRQRLAAQAAVKENKPGSSETACQLTNTPSSVWRAARACEWSPKRTKPQPLRGGTQGC